MRNLSNEEEKRDAQVLELGGGRVEAREEEGCFINKITNG